MLISNWLNALVSRVRRRPRYNSRSRRALRKRWQAVQNSQLTTAEVLEVRQMLTTTLYLDFGQGFTDGELNTTVDEFKKIDTDNNNGLGINNHGTGSDLTNFGPTGIAYDSTDRLQASDDLKFQPLSYDFDGDSDIDIDDLTTLASEVLAIIQQSLERMALPLVFDLCLRNASIARLPRV